METENRKATFKEEQESLKRIGAKLKLDKEIDTAINKEIDTAINKKMPKFLEVGYKRNLPKELLIKIVKDTMMTEISMLVNNYCSELLFIDPTDGKHASKLKKIRHKYIDRADFDRLALIRMLDYIAKNYKPNKDSEAKL